MKHCSPQPRCFTGAAGNRLVADMFGDTGRPCCCCTAAGRRAMPGARPQSIWAAPARTAYALDQRGHGDSEWVADGSYAFTDFAADAAAVADDDCGARRQAADRDRRLARRHRVAAGRRRGRKGGHGPLFAAMVLVDITPRVDLGGVAKIQGFMRARAAEGFTSIAEAADAVAAYLPHRPRPRSHEGLQQESAAASRRPLALALGSALARRASGRSRSIASSSRRR